MRNDIERRIELEKKYWELRKKNAIDGSEEERKAAIELENLRYKDEQEKYKDNLEVLEQLRIEHEAIIADISEKSVRKWIEDHQAEIDYTISSLQSMANALGQYYDYKNAKEKQSFDNFTKTQDEERKRLQRNLSANVISQATYDAQIARLDEEKDRKQRKLEHDAAKRARTQAIINATIQGLQATLSAYASGAATPFIGPATGAIFAGIAAAFAALQIGLIAATPLPSAARGKLIRGNSHSTGGETIEAQDGEAILNREATRRNLPYLDYMQRSTGGVPFINDGGYAAAMAANSMQGGGISVKDLAALKIFVTVDDITRATNRVNVVKNRASA